MRWSSSAGGSDRRTGRARPGGRSELPDRGPGGRRCGRHVRRADPRPAGGRRDRPDLLHRGQRPAAGRGVAEARCSTSCTAARSGCTAPSACVPTREDAPADAVRRLRHRQGRDRALPAEVVETACRDRRSTRDTSADPAGRRSTLPVTSTSPSSRRLRKATNWRCRTSGSRPSTTCMPPTWPASSWPRWRTGPSRSARASTPSPTAR